MLRLPIPSGLRPLILAFSLIVAACGETDGTHSSETLLRVEFFADDGMGNPALLGLDNVVTGSTQIGLTMSEASGRVVPGLATSWRVSADGRSYIFKLREAYWADGRRITSGDVVAVLRRIIAPGSHNPLKPLLMRIAEAPAIAANRKPVRMLGISDPLPDVVVIDLSQPEPSLLQLLAHPAATIIRREKTPPASGPYSAVPADEDDRSLRLVRNPAFFNADTVSIDEIVLAETNNIDASIGRFVAGKIDILTGAKLSGLNAARAVQNQATLHLDPSWGLYSYLARTGGGPLADIRVRRALAMSFERSNIIDRVLGGSGAQAAFGALAPTLPDAYAGSGPDWALWTPDVRQTEAARLLAEAGYSPANPLTLNVALPRGKEHEQLLGQLAAYWGAYGIRIKAFKRGAEAHRKAIAQGDFDLAAIERIAPAPVPGYFLSPFTCAERMGGYCNPAVDQLLKDAEQVDDAGERIQLQRRANRLISEDAPLIAVMSPVRWSLVSPRVSGWQSNIAGTHVFSGLRVTGPPLQEQ